ncbi:MAG: TRAP transporter large permease subunit [Roseovarius sp.]|uniref:TRAP transporter large permease subunit n=1 Tax=Thalassococcus profundi TaxID=2282382 RepID=UPI004057F454
MSALVDVLPLVMFAALAVGMFTGLPVAFVLGGVGVVFGGLVILLGEMPAIMFFNLVPRIWGGIAENLVLVSVPSFIFMGTMLERSGLAEDLLSALDFIFIGATAFSLIFRILGGDELIEGIIAALGVGPWGTLGLIMGVMFVLGFFLDWVEITLIILPVFTPIIIGLDFAPHVARGDVIFWFAILIAINLQTSFLTPPFGMSLFYLKAIAGRQVAMATIFRGVLPFVLLQLVGLGLVMAFPEIALSLPDRMLN